MAASQSRQILAAGISPFGKAKVVPLNVLIASFTSVLLKAWGVQNFRVLEGSKEPFEGVLFVEGQKRALEVDGVYIFSMPFEMIDGVVDIYLDTAQKTSGDESSGQNLMILALGSPIFCQDIIRFAGINRKGQIDASINKFTDRVACAESGEVIWMDSETDEALHEGNIIAMFTDAKRMGIIPD